MYSYITKHNSPNFTRQADSTRTFGHYRIVRAITLHHWGDPAGNPKFDAVVNWLVNPASGVSAHFVVESGKVAQLVNDKDVAWHAGSAYGNATTLGIEANPRASQGDINTVAELVRDLRKAYGWLPVVGHNQWTITACPGRYSPQKISELADRI